MDILNVYINICVTIYFLLFFYVSTFFKKCEFINKSDIHGVIYCCSKNGNCIFLDKNEDYCSKYNDDLVRYKLSLKICNIKNGV